jgi:hypothetical protein
MTSVANSLAWGATLIDWRTDSLLRVPDPFLLCSIAKPKPAGAAGRLGYPLGAQGRLEADLNLITALRARAGHGPGQEAARLGNG